MHADGSSSSCSYPAAVSPCQLRIVSFAASRRRTVASSTETTTVADFCSSAQRWLGYLFAAPSAPWLLHHPELPPTALAPHFPALAPPRPR